MRKTEYHAPAVAKMLEIVELLAEKQQGMSMNELSKKIESPINMVYRICKELERKGYLEKNADSGTYQLGAGFYYIGAAAKVQNELLSCSSELIRELCEQVQETVHLCTYDAQNKKMILFAQEECSNPIRFHVQNGAVLIPHGSAFGKCILANLAEEELSCYLSDGLCGMNKNTVTSEKVLCEQLAQIRKTNYAFDYEEYVDGIVCVGAPIFGRGHKIIAAAGIVAPKYRFDETKMQQAVTSVLKCAKQISIRMGDLNDGV